MEPDYQQSLIQFAEDCSAILSGYESVSSCDIAKLFSEASLCASPKKQKDLEVEAVIGNPLEETEKKSNSYHNQLEQTNKKKVTLSGKIRMGIESTRVNFQ